MDKRGMSDLWSNIIAVVLALLIIFIATDYLTGFFGMFASSTMACEERGGMCVSSCSPSQFGPGTHRILEGDGACTEGGVCCTSDQIQKQINSRAILPGSNMVSLTVEGRSTKYYNDEEVPLMVGRPHDFEIDANEAANNGHLKCIIDVYSEDVEDVIRNDEQEPLYEGTCKDDISVSWSFAQRDMDRDLKIRTRLYESTDAEEEDYSKQAFFDLDLRLPVRTTLRDGWFKENTLEVTCLGAGCTTMTHGYVENQNECNPSTPDDIFQTESEFDQEGKVTIEFDEDRFSDASVINHFVCMRVQLDSDQTITTSSYGTLRLDFEDPEIEGVDNMEILCDDGEGSGCQRYYYKILQGQTLDDLVEKRGAGVLDTFLNNALTELLISDEMCGLHGTGYSSSPYIRAPGDIVGGVACVSAEDAVGNIGQPEVVKFVDEDKLRQIANEETRRAIYNALTS